MLSIVKYFLEELNIDINVKDDFQMGFTLLEFALMSNNIDMLYYLLETYYYQITDEVSTSSLCIPFVCVIGIDALSFSLSLSLSIRISIKQLIV